MNVALIVRLVPRLAGAFLNAVSGWMTSLHEPWVRSEDGQASWVTSPYPSLSASGSW